MFTSHVFAGESNGGGAESAVGPLTEKKRAPPPPRPPPPQLFPDGNKPYEGKPTLPGAMPATSAIINSYFSDVTKLSAGDGEDQSIPEVKIPKRNPKLYQLVAMESEASFWWDSVDSSISDANMNDSPESPESPGAGDDGMYDAGGRRRPAVIGWRD